jgi:hypothetical protein
VPIEAFALLTPTAKQAYFHFTHFFLSFTFHASSTSLLLGPLAVGYEFSYSLEADAETGE